MIWNSDITDITFIVTPISKLITCRCPILLQSPPGLSSLERISGGRAIFWHLEGDHKRWWFLSMAKKCVANASWATLGFKPFISFLAFVSITGCCWLVCDAFSASKHSSVAVPFLPSLPGPKNDSQETDVGLRQRPTARHCGSCFSFFNGCRPVDWTRYCFCTLWAELILWFSQNTTNSHWQNRSDPENTYITYYILG